MLHDWEFAASSDLLDLPREPSRGNPATSMPPRERAALEAVAKRDGSGGVERQFLSIAIYCRKAESELPFSHDQSVPFRGPKS
jgi:hypothetical protein